MNTKSLVIFSLIVCLLQFITSINADCSDHVLCGNCVNIGTNESCGWCSDDNTCRQGSIIGPGKGTCNNWVYGDVLECPTPTWDCNQFEDCVTCSSFSECGWCPDNRSCMKGDITGPSEGSCTHWTYDFFQCRDDTFECGDINECDTCTMTSSCGWCGETGTCMRGYSGGPIDLTCSDISWTYYPFQCTPKIPPEHYSGPCEKRDTCDTCNQEPGCGWCRSSRKCMPGNAKGPLIGTCEDWNTTHCDLPENPCPKLKNCFDCVDNELCSWCQDDNKCELRILSKNCTEIITIRDNCPVTKKSSKWWIGLIVILILVAVGGAGFYVWKGRKASPKPPHGSFRLGDEVDNEVYDDVDDDDDDELVDDLDDNKATEDDSFNPRANEESLI